MDGDSTSEEEKEEEKVEEEEEEEEAKEGLCTVMDGRSGIYQKRCACCCTALIRGMRHAEPLFL